LTKQERSRRTYQQVLDAAAAEFIQHGYPNTNLNRVADRTGLTKGALYGHFTSKQALADELVRHLEQSTEAILARAESSTDPALGHLRTLTRALAQQFESDPRLRAAIRLLDEGARAQIKPSHLLTNVQRVTLVLVRRAQLEGQLDASLPPEPVADLFVVTLFGAYYTMLGADEDSLLRRIDDMWSLLLPALVKEEPVQVPFSQ